MLLSLRLKNIYFLIYLKELNWAKDAGYYHSLDKHSVHEKRKLVKIWDVNHNHKHLKKYNIIPLFGLPQKAKNSGVHQRSWNLSSAWKPSYSCWFSCQPSFLKHRFCFHSPYMKLLQQNFRGIRLFSILPAKILSKLLQTPDIFFFFFLSLINDFHGVL